MALHCAACLALRGDILLGTVLEGQRLRNVERRLGLGGLAGFDGIDAVVGQPPTFGGLGACLRQAEGRQRAQPHLARPSAQGETENPGFRDMGGAIAGYLQIKTGTVGVHAGRLRSENLERGESAHKLRHVRPTCLTHTSTHAVDAFTHTLG